MIKHSIPLEKGGLTNNPDRIVIHAMGEFIKYEGRILHAVDFLREIGLSAHALVCPDGAIIRCRTDNLGAYHAKGHNTNTLGMEFLVRGVHDYESFINTIKGEYLTFDQFQAGVEQCYEWALNYTITDIVRHSDIDPKRKKDPGTGFPWNQFLRNVWRP